MERSLSSALGRDVAILKKGEGAGEVRIAFKSLAELDELCRKLTVPQPAAASF